MNYPWPKVDMESVFKSRKKRIFKMMDDKGVDLLFISEYANTSYMLGKLAGTTTNNAWETTALIVGKDNIMDATYQASLFYDFPMNPKIALSPIPEAGWKLGTIYSYSSMQHPGHQPEAWSDKVAKALKNRGAKRVGIDWVDYTAFEMLKAKVPDIEFVGITPELAELMRIKEPEIVKLIEAGAEKTAIAMARAMASAQEGMTDSEVMAIATKHATELGYHRPMHVVTLQGDVQEGLTWLAKGRRLWSGDTLDIDLNFRSIWGLEADFARLIFIGEPHPEVLALYREMIIVTHEILAEVKVGDPCGVIFEKFLEWQKSKGLPETSIIGHGTGFHTTEYPTLNPGDPRKQVFEVGNVISVEPMFEITVDGKSHFLHSEDVLVMEENGLRRLTPLGYHHVPNELLKL